MQFLINGIISGSAIALLALAFQTVYLPTRVFFVSLAGIYSLAPYISHALLKTEVGLILATTLTVIFCCSLCLLIEWANHAPLTHKGASEGGHLIASLGIYIVIIQAVAMIWGSKTKVLHNGIEATTNIAGVICTQSQWTMLAVSSTLILGFILLLMKTDVGLSSDNYPCPSATTIPPVFPPHFIIQWW